MEPGRPVACPHPGEAGDCPKRRRTQSAAAQGLYPGSSTDAPETGSAGEGTVPSEGGVVCRRSAWTVPSDGTLMHRSTPASNHILHRPPLFGHTAGP
jgi:hypothetical protein